ncbi:MAG: hypothetical protein FWD74_01015, partial [Actinomycetia bacterium]|nr:hypothetical protein [Actinomycetes bacterium]
GGGSVKAWALSEPGSRNQIDGAVGQGSAPAEVGGGATHGFGGPDADDLAKSGADLGLWLG